MERESTVDLLVAEIRACLETHQYASDTADGIAAWWVQGTPSQRDVEQALARLVASGEMRENRSSTGVILYAKAKR